MTLWGSSACSSHFVFHKKQHLSFFDLAEKSSARPLGVNLDLAKGHGTAQQLNSSSVFVTLAVIYSYHKFLQSPSLFWAASITLSPLSVSPLILCIALRNHIHFVSLFFLLSVG